jgi:hypothetical protein
MILQRNYADRYADPHDGEIDLVPIAGLAPLASARFVVEQAVESLDRNLAESAVVVINHEIGTFG